jgi:hypothetical protein
MMKCLDVMGLCHIHALVAAAASASRSSELRPLPAYDSRSGGDVQTFSLSNLFSPCGGDASAYLHY